MITEKEFSQQIVDAARTFGWKVYRTWRSIHSPAGYPDLTMVRRDRIVFAELKSEKGKPPTDAQEEWLQVLREVGTCEVYLWRPKDFDEIMEILE